MNNWLHGKDSTPTCMETRIRKPTMARDHALINEIVRKMSL